jgi:hypothetical protein
MFRMADCAAIVNELGVVDWFSLFSRRGIDGCVHLFYEMIWSCFEKHVPTRFFRGGQKLITSELRCLNKKKTKAAKRSRASEKRCLEDQTIDDCECEHLRGDFSHSEKSIRRKALFWLCGFEKQAR